jgi:dTDP-4-dehydrorhamnose reductase
VRALRPQLIVNAAAYTAVDRAEDERDAAMTINADAPSALAAVAADRGAWLLHYSTDQVFDGSGAAPWVEDAPTAPLNAYGRSKAEGERLIRASGCRHLILRTSWVHSAHGENFASRILALAALHDRIEVVDDQVGAPTGADWLADVGVRALLGCARGGASGGTYHAAAAGQTSFHGYAVFVVQLARQLGLALRLRPEDIRPVRSGDRVQRAPRPLNARLDTTRLRTAFGIEPPDWRDGVASMLAQRLAPHNRT